MREISNSTLALLVVAAIVVSISGSLISLNKLGEIGGITGMLSTTDIGYANLSVPVSAYINLTDNWIDLHTIDIDGYNCSDDVEDWWILRNDGSVGINIRIYDQTQDEDGGPDNNAGRGPFDSTDTSGCLGTPGGTSACFMVKCMNTTAYGNASDGTFCNTTYAALDNTSSGRFLVVNLSTLTDNRTAFFGVNATVPYGESAGEKVEEVTVEASQST
jgi:hypothetical protein